MKKIILLLILITAFQVKAQEYQIQILLVDEEVGYPIGQPDVPPYYEAVSNDAGLNTIFEAHNATAYYPGNGQNPVPGWEDRTHFVLCNGCDVNQFEQDLLNYSTVVEKTFQSEPGYMANVLYVEILDENNGNPTGDTTPEGYIITTNAELNILFENYKVLYYERTLIGIFDRLYLLGCDCLASELQVELDAFTEVIENTELIGYVVLSTPEFNKLDIKLYPNPIENRLEVKTTEIINSYQIIDIAGLEIANVKTIEALNQYLPSLSTGIYVLNITTEAGKKGSYKLLKN